MRWTYSPLLAASPLILAFIWPLGMGVAEVLSPVTSQQTLFPLSLPQNEWAEFNAQGFSTPVTGMVYSAGKPPTCGVALGGISTGCLDIEAGGVFGFNSIFIPLPHRPQLLTPFLGISTGCETWVLADKRYIVGGDVQGNCDPRVEVDPKEWIAHLTPLESVKPAQAIHYWGHYPVADLEYESDCPVGAGLRAWSPLIPGDTLASDIPAAVFEVHLRNKGVEPRKGTLAFSFPGPTHMGTHPQWAILSSDDLKPIVWPNLKGLSGWCAPGWPELAEEDFYRESISGDLNGITITGREGAGFVLGVIGSGAKVRTGGSLSESGTSWSRIAECLPEVIPRSTTDDVSIREDSPSNMTYGHSGASVAVDFDLDSHEDKVIRFVLAWYSPTWKGTPETTYTRAYTARYQDATEVAQKMARDHESLLQRVLSWQQTVYSEKAIPGWLQDGLINSLYLITETSLWTSPSPPISSWCPPQGLFGMIESPRGCPQTECLPCTWYGTLPILFFFPDLAELNLRGHLHYQREDGAAAFNWGEGADMSKPLDYAWQVMLNGFCFVDLNYRFWERSGFHKDLLELCYPAVKKSTNYSMSLRSGPDFVISMPEGNKGEEWWEHSGWFGMTAHAGGLRLSQIQMAQNMAEVAGDTDFVEQCRLWLKSGTDSMEGKMWNETTGSYLTAYEPETGQKNNDIMANQFDADWITSLHGMPGNFAEPRIIRGLETIEKTCLVDTIGAVSFANPDGSPQLASYGIFVPEIYMLGMTFLYHGKDTTGLEILRRCLHNQFSIQKIGWDQTNMLRATDGGIRTVGSDYYQNTILWAAPAAVIKKPLSSLYEQGGFVQRIISAGEKK